MLSLFIKNLSILKKFLFINLIIFLFISILTILYLRSIQPGLIKNKTTNHIQIIKNTTDHINRLKINFTEIEIRKFLFSTRFLFQNLDRVVIFDSQFNLIGDTDTLDLDPRSFSQKLEIVEMDILGSEIKKAEKKKQNTIEEKSSSFLKKKLINYAGSIENGKSFTITEDSYDNFLLITMKNVNIGDKDIGYLVITETANDIKVAIGDSAPTIIWNDDNGKEHTHYPDIFIVSQNKLIDAKSDYILKERTKGPYKKQEAAKKMGYKYEIRVYNEKGDLIERHN